MAVPKRRKSRAKRDMRRANHMRVLVPDLSVCPQCRRPKVPHRVCLNCGFYKGEEVIDIVAREQKRGKAGQAS